MKLRQKSTVIFTILLALCISPLFPSTLGYSQEQPRWEGQIVYIGADGNLWLARGDELQPFQLTDDASEQRRYSSPVFSARGDMLAYCINDSGNDSGGEGPSQIYLMRSGAWQPILVAGDAYCNTWPQGSFSFSPDGSQIAYARTFQYGPQADGSQWSQYQGIWVADIVNGSTGELVPPPGNNPLVLPMWSPDGKWLRLYELVSAEGLGVLRTWEKESGALYNWLDIGADIFAGFADWSPDSSRLVFDESIYIGYPGAGIFTATPGAADLKQIYDNTGNGALQPLWSPDGGKLAFLLRIYGDSEQSILATSKPDGSDVLWAFSSPASLGLLDWSPDSNQLLFTSTESTETGAKTSLYIYDLTGAEVYPVAEPAGSQAVWAPIPSAEKPSAGEGSAQLVNFQAQGNPLAYLAGNFQLMLYDPNSGDQLELSPPLAAVDYWASPSGTRLVYGDQLLRLEFNADGKLAVRETSLPAAPVNDQIIWSPSENRLAIQDANGRVWMVDASGDYVEIPGASGLPAWSYDERYLSYCTDGDRLWVVGGGVSLRELAAPVDCQVQWSPSQPLLAYIQEGMEDNIPVLFVYDAERGVSDVMMEAVELDSWSPDGKLLAARKIEPGGAYTIFAIDPRGGKSLEVGQFEQTAPGMRGWGDVEADYLYGPYQFDERLNKSEKIAETLFDTGLGGRILLAGQTNGGLTDIVCLDMSSGDARTLLSVNLSGIPRSERPGLWSFLSPDAAWSSTYTFDPADYRYMLTRCDRTRQVSIEAYPPANDSSQGSAIIGDSFSPDSVWYLQVVPGGEEQSQVLLYDLTTLDRQSLPVMSSAPVTWVQTPPISAAGTAALEGLVTGPGGEPLVGATILVDGQAAGTTDERGAFTITGLAEGKYALSVQMEGLAFEPQEILVTLPSEDAGEITFAARQGAEQAQQTESAAVIQPDATTQAGSSTSEGIPTTEPEGGGDQTGAVSGSQGDGAGDGLQLGGREIAAIMIAVTCLFLFLVFIIFLIRFLAFRRSGKDKEPPAPEKPLEGAASTPTEATSKGGMAPEIDALLHQGVAEVKAGNAATGLEKLQQVTQAAPESAVAWLWSGMAAAKLKEWVQAEACFLRARDLGHPKGDEALKWLQAQKKGKNSK